MLTALTIADWENTRGNLKGLCHHLLPYFFQNQRLSSSHFLPKISIKLNAPSHLLFSPSILSFSSFYCLNSPMARSNASSSSASRHGLLPVCGCEVAMRFWIANTAINRGRRFWKCKNSGKAASCGLFVWDDDLDYETMKFVSVSEENEDLATQISPTQIDCQNFKEWESKKVAKLKQKLCEERKKLRWMQAIVVLVVVLFVLQKFDIAAK